MKGRQLVFMADGIEYAFQQFHHTYPEVYAELVALAREWKKAGHTSGSIAMDFEVLRRRRGLANVHDHTGLKLNNSYRSRYARLIMATERDLAGFYPTRVLADERVA